MEEITVEEWRAEIDGLRRDDSRGRTVVFTEQQMKILVYARSGPRPLSWRKISNLWKEKGWMGHSQKTLEAKYDKAVEMGLVDVENMR